MAAGLSRAVGESRRFTPASSSGHGNRFDSQRTIAPQVLCRNGPQCRKYQEGTCNYSHDFTSLTSNGLANSKKSLNADSPSFTPKVPDIPATKTSAMSPKAAIAAAFTPRVSNSVTSSAYTHSKEPSVEFVPSQQPVSTPSAFTVNEFIPGHSFVQQQTQEDHSTNLTSQLSNYGDPFLSHQMQQGISSLDGARTQINPYAHASAGVSTQNYFSDTSTYLHPLNYHLYAGVGPKRELQHPYQRSTSDFFIADDLRESLQKKSEAALQTFANSTLPPRVEYFHTLVSLDITVQKNAAIFGLPTTVYKAVSAKDGRLYALRRVEGFRLSDEAAIRTLHAWKRINNASIVRVYDVFTGRWFGDSSLIVVTEYHPMSQTVTEKFFPSSRHSTNNRASVHNPSEQDLWGYIVQISNAIHTIHEAGLAARCILPSKILVTSQNRLRLNCCGVLDILQFDQQRPIHELQRADLEDLGKLILGLATRSPTAHQNMDKALLLLSQNYSERFRACVRWLLSPPPSSPSNEPRDVHEMSTATYTVGTLLGNIADQVISVMDSGLQKEDVQTNELMRELENARLVRLLAKLNVILERTDSSLTRNGSMETTSAASAITASSNAWSETGERYHLKLFRDYVFHQVDAEGRPVLDLGHIIACLNKLDAGIDERVQLVSRDEQSTFIVTYRDIKRGVESAWTEISKAAATHTRT